MENGVFSQIIYQQSGVQLGTVPRELLLIGPPLITEKKRWLANITIEAGGNYVISDASPELGILKPFEDCHLFRTQDFKIYAKKPDWMREDAIDITSALSGSISTTNYNSGSGTILTLPYANLAAINGFSVGDTLNIYYDIVVSREYLYSKRVEISSIDVLSSLFGQNSLNDQDSVLAYNSLLATTFGANKKFYIYGADMTGYTGDPVEYLNDPAVHDDITNSIKRYHYYYIVPLVKMVDKADYEQIIEKYALFVESQSTPAARKECRTYFAKPIVKDGDGLDYAGNGFFFELGEIDGTYYKIKAAEDVNLAVNYPAKINSMRVTLIGDYYAILYGDIIEGCELATIMAAWRASLPKGHSTTGSIVPGISSVPHFGYYNEDQYRRLRNAGWTMLIQESEYSAVRVYQQVTTMTEIIEQREESLPIILDAFAMELRLSLKGMIGRGVFNKISSDPNDPATSKYLARVRQVAQAVINKYVKNKWLAKAEVIGLAQNELYPDQADLRAKVEHYYPVNQIHTTILVV